MNESVIVKNLSKNFDSLQAVSNLSFSIFPGQVVGFIGANGAGKTTTMRLMATLDAPSYGQIEIGGYDTIHYPEKVKHLIGWMPDFFDTYPHTTTFEYLDFYARAYGYIGREREERVHEIMEFTELSSLSDRFVDTFSKGMKQRLCLGRMLIHDPPVLIMDEPAAGLDPKARIEFKHLVSLLAEEGKSIFISSHILSELDDMCDGIVFIDHGRLVHHGSTEGLKNDNLHSVVIDVKTAGEQEKLQEWLVLSPGIKVLESIPNGFRVSSEFCEPEQLSLMLKRMLNDGLTVIDFHRRERKLEDAFIEIVERGNRRP